MSKLIKEESKEQAAQAVTAMLPLSSSTVVNHLKACQKIAAERATASFQKFYDEYQNAISEQIKEAKSNQEAVDLSGALRAVTSKREEVLRYYCGYLSEGFVRFKKRQLNTTIGNELEGDTTNLELMGNEFLEESIAITTITQRADGYFAEPIWALNQRFAVLNGGEHVTEASNPAAPIQFCESLRKALKLLPPNIHIKTLAYKSFDRSLLDVIRIVTEEINQYLKSQGVLPHLRYTVPTGQAPASYLSESEGAQKSTEEESQQQFNRRREDLDPNLPPEQYQQNLLAAIRGLQNQMVLSGVPQGGTAPGVVIDESQLIAALQVIQHRSETATASATAEQPVDAADIHSVVAQLREIVKKGEEDADVEKGDMQTIDLVGMLFEYMLNDENLPDRVKALLSYLHTPFLKIAFIDPGFFEKPDHPARLLLNSLAEAGSRWVGNDGTQQYDIYEKIRETVDKILKELDQDIKIITTLLLEFNSYTKSIIRRQELMEKRATEKAQGEEKLREVKLRVNDEIRKRTHNRELPSALLLFLLQPWSDYLSFALLRYGENSDKWNNALILVDEVLWSIQPKSTAREKERQNAIHDGILDAIKSGFDTIGFDQTKGKKLIEAVSSLMRLALQSKSAEPAPQPMRHKLEQIAAEKAGESPANDEGHATEEELQMVEKLKIIEFGTWFEFEGGRRLKIAWYNARTSHYMLVDQMGKRVDMMSGLKMARQMIQGKAKIISGSSKPFFERALENIYHKLHEQAEVAKKEESTESGEADGV